MTAFMLESVNITDWTIMESSGRVGGRVRTAYLAGTQPEDYQYQEMGPMRCTFFAITVHEISN